MKSIVVSLKCIYARKTLYGLLFIIVIGTVAVPSHAQNGPLPKHDQVTFHLSIPEQASFTETRTVKNIVDLGDKSPTEIQTISQTSDIVIRRRGTGFLVSVRPRPAKEWEPPGSAAQGIAAALRGMNVQYEFDGQGNLVAMRGLDKLREELSSALPEMMKPMLDTLLPRMIEQIKEEWGSRYAGLVGQTFRVGYRQKGEMPITLMPQLPPVTAKIGRGVINREPCNGGECVVFFMGYVIDNADGYGETVSMITRDWLRQMLEGLGGTSADPLVKEMRAKWPKLKVTEMMNVTERLIDPQTMTVYFEKQSKGYIAVVDGSQEMTWMEITTLEYKRVN